MHGDTKEGDNKKKRKKGEKTEKSIPPCTVAPSAEHAGAHHDDEPCDDSREGKIDED